MEGNYTQINVLFPSSQVELPPADKFNAFPPEAKKAILDAFNREQAERHKWLTNQQNNEHALNMQSGKYNYRWRIMGTTMGAIVLISAIGFASWLVKNGASTIGVFLMLTAIGAMIGSAIYGQKSSSSNSNPSESDKSESDGKQS